MTLIHSWCSVSDYLCDYKDVFLIFSVTALQWEKQILLQQLAVMSSGSYSFYDHLFCRYMKKSFDDCWSSKSTFSFAIFGASDI